MRQGSKLKRERSVIKRLSRKTWVGPQHSNFKKLKLKHRPQDEVPTFPVFLSVCALFAFLMLWLNIMSTTTSGKCYLDLWF